MLDLKRLRVLGEVARQSSFSAAAEALYLSQSAVSQQVATLEREVGMPLLDRTRNGPKLNEAGKTLVGHAEAALSRLEEAERELKAIAGLEGGELRIASFASASATLLTEALGEFAGRHPEVRLSVTEAEPEDSLPRLRAAETDLDRGRVAVSGIEPGAPVRELTGAGKRDHSPEWSPDGQQVAFLSRKGARDQLFVAPAQGGEARQLTSVPDGVQAAPGTEADGGQHDGYHHAELRLDIEMNALHLGSSSVSWLTLR